MYDIKIDTIKKIWDEILQKMQTQLDVNAFNTFFLPIIAKEIKDNKLIVEFRKIFLNRMFLCIRSVPGFVEAGL